MENTYTYIVTIKGRTTKTELAVSEYQAVDQAYSKYGHIEPVRKKYSAKKAKNTSKRSGSHIGRRSR